MATLHELITKVIPLKGILRIPSYWMRKVLTAIADAIEAVNTESALRDSVLQSGKTSMTYFPKSNSVLLQDGNGYVQLFGTRSGDGTMIVKLLDSYDNVEFFGSPVTAENGIITYHRPISNKLLTLPFGDTGNRIESIDFSSFCTANVTDMANMFWGCKSLTSLDVSNFDTSAVTSMSGMFNSCSKLTSLDLSNFDTSAVTEMYDMFKNCTALRNIKCKQAFKDWCVANASTISLTVSNITWEIVE